MQQDFWLIWLMLMGFGGEKRRERQDRPSISNDLASPLSAYFIICIVACCMH